MATFVELHCKFDGLVPLSFNNGPIDAVYHECDPSVAYVFVRIERGASLTTTVDPPPPPPLTSTVDYEVVAIVDAPTLDATTPTSARAPPTSARVPPPAPPADHPDPLPALPAKLTEDEDRILLAGVETHGKNWVAIHRDFPKGTKRSVDSLKARYDRLKAGGKAGKGKGKAEK
ncbi:hypothetical protein V6N11_037540 [Hibiscus sabdariffa]|uniref:Uncharacterized protein n=2 Tax=Hibiscus sabdariffa TaxID=183260 RepID=A0ABR2AKB1_9ROSI